MFEYSIEGEVDPYLIAAYGVAAEYVAESEYAGGFSALPMSKEELARDIIVAGCSMGVTMCLSSVLEVVSHLN